MRNRRLPAENKKIEKSEDKEWRKWYETLGNKDHESMLKQLGLDEEDISDWERMKKTGKSLEELAGEEGQSPISKTPKALKGAKPKRK